MHILSPVFSTSRLSCLLAHMQESMTNLNCRPSSLSNATRGYQLKRCFEIEKARLTRKAIEIDGFEQFEELNSVLRVLGEVLVDHLERTFEDILHDRWHFVFHKALQDVSTIFNPSLQPDLVERSGHQGSSLHEAW